MWCEAVEDLSESPRQPATKYKRDNPNTLPPMYRSNHEMTILADSILIILAAILATVLAVIAP